MLQVWFPDEMDFLIKTNETTLAQIADSLEYLPTKTQKTNLLKMYQENIQTAIKFLLSELNQN